MKKPHIIFCEQWRNEIILFWGFSPKKYIKSLASYWIKDFEEPKWLGETTVTKSGWIVIWVKEMDAIDMLKVLNHEIFHATDYLLREKVGIDLTNSSCESYAYTMEWMQSKLYEYIKLEPNITIWK